MTLAAAASAAGAQPIVATYLPADDEPRLDLGTYQHPAGGRTPKLPGGAGSASHRGAGDTHNAWASDLQDAAGRQAGVEFATPAVSSPGLEAYLPDENPVAVAAGLARIIGPLVYANTKDRGLVLLTATPDECRAEWRYVSTVQSAACAAFTGRVLRDIALVVCAAWFLIRLAGGVGERVVARRRLRGDDADVTTVDALVKLARLLAVGGVGGLAVGLAARDLPANFLGGLTIQLDRPLCVGEWIRSPDKNLEGVVGHISWRHTRIRAFNENPIYVPNAVFTTIDVENPSRRIHRRLRETIGVRHRDFDAVPAIVDDVRDMLREHPAIDGTQALKQELLLRIGRIVAAHGAAIAFPTRTLHVGAEAPDVPAVGATR